MEQGAKGFRRLIVWQKGHAFAIEVYRVSKAFPKEEIFGLVSQLRRAAVSIPANIAEGYERNHRKEYLQFLHIAKGSLGEIETYLSLAKDLRYLSDDECLTLESKRGEIGRLLTGLIKSLT